MNLETTASAALAFERGATAGAREFLWAPAAGFARGAWRAPAGSRFAAAVLEGYSRLVHAAKLWNAERRWSERTVVEVRHGARLLVVRRDWRETIERLLSDSAGGATLGGGRGGTARFETDQGPVVVRRGLRGGAMRWLGDRHFGFRPRPLCELPLLQRARRRGLPVPEPLAAVVERRFPLVYRGLLVMAELSGGETLWERMRRAPSPALFDALGRELRRLHDEGLFHPDLNLNNILVLPAAGEPRFAFVDLDRARLGASPLPERCRRRSLRRVRRSARRLDPEGRVVTEADLGRLEAAYRVERAGGPSRT
jgi:3-deoxy-D-manno-octulosonic acid kinase